MKRVLRELITRFVKFFIKKARIQQEILKSVDERLNTIEYRSFNRRFYAIEQIVGYMVSAQIPGDYCEFGVYKGDTFKHAYAHMHKHFPGMRFFAFDSFEGLPKPQGVDESQGYTGNFHENEFSCSQEEFLSNMRKNSVDISRVVTVKGWFDETLKSSSYGIEKMAVIWIDCDLYESTVPVLNYITPFLSSGTVIVFDDWHCFKNNPNYGEQRACREWLERNPAIILNELFSFGWDGMAFTVQ
jgi:O-methyltransferase